VHVAVLPIVQNICQMVLANGSALSSVSLNEPGSFVVVHLRNGARMIVVHQQFQ